MKIRMSVRAWLVAPLALASAAFGQRVAETHSEPAKPSLAAPIDRRFSVSYRDTSVRDALADLGVRSRLKIRPIWSDVPDSIGLDPEARVDLVLTRAPLALILDALLAQCDAGVGGGATWQIADDGAIEAGPRSALNRHPVTRLYDIHDLLAATPNFPEGAVIDLQAALQGQSGAGSIRETDYGEQPRPRPDRSQDLLDLITQTIEPEQWWIAGGEATIRIYNGHLVVRAAPYVQRQIVNGNPAPQSDE